MAIEILTNNDGSRAAMFCNTTDWAFGPVCYSSSVDAGEWLEAFLQSLDTDARLFTDAALESAWSTFVAMNRRCGHCDKFVEWQDDLFDDDAEYDRQDKQGGIGLEFTCTACVTEYSLSR